MKPVKEVQMFFEGNPKSNQMNVELIAASPPSQLSQNK